MSTTPPSDSGATIGFEAEKPTTPTVEFNAARLSIRIAGDPALVPGYEILGELGRGGMGVVYKARQISLNRLVALKMIIAGSHAAESVLARFKTEAEAIARLQHPNIVQIYEIGEHQGQPFFSLELVEGGSLAGKINGMPQKPRDAALLVEVLARAMHLAHDLGIVHRDLKPSNILLQPDPKSNSPSGSFRVASRSSLQTVTEFGTPKITDFGLAKNLGTQVGQTHTGSIMGTPSYMSPEQAAGENKLIGPPTDIYALGAILYELLTGRPPFRADTPINTIMQVIRGEPVPPSRLQAKLPRDLETITLKCLEKPLTKRYPSALHLADDLQRFLEGLPITARPAGPIERTVKWVKRRPTLAGLLVTLVLAGITLVGGGIWAYAAVTRRAAEAEKAHGEAAAAVELNRQRLVRLCVANGARQLDTGDLYGALLWFAEGLKLDPGTRESEATHRRRLGTVLAQSPQLRQVWVHEGPVTVVAFRPDGACAVTAGADGVARVWDPVTGKAVSHPLDHGGPILFATILPDGQRLLTGGSDGFARVWDILGAKCLQTLGTGSALVKAAAHPDNRRVAMAAKAGGVRYWDTVAGQPLSPILPNAKVTELAFSSDGSVLLAGGDDGLLRLWDSTTYNPVVPPIKHGAAVTAAAFSPDGKRVATATAAGAVMVWHVKTGEPAMPRPLKHRSAVHDIAFSPDGRWLATSAEDKSAQVWDLDGGVRLAPPMMHGSPVTQIVFSPDGRWVATTSDDNTARVWDAATSEPVSPVLRHNGTPLAVAFSPDGRSVLTGSPDGLARIWTLRPQVRAAAERAAPPVATSNQAIPSPDGRYVITFGSEPYARVRWAANREPVAPPLRHDGPVTTAAFSPDGKWVVTAGSDGVVQSWETTTGRSRWSEPPRHASRIYRVAVSPDGHRVATGSDDNSALLLDATTGQPLVAPIRHSGGIVHVAFGTAGDTLFTASQDGTSRVWDVATGEPLTPPLPPWDGKPWQEDLPQDDRPADELVKLAQVLAGTKINTTGGRSPLATAAYRDQWTELHASYPADFTPAAGSDIAWHQVQADASEAAGQWYAAAWQLARWSALEPQRADVRRRRAKALAKLGEWSQMAADADAAIVLDPGDWQAWQHRGVARAELKQWDDALADLAQAHILADEPERKIVFSALLRLDKGDVAGYRAACRALLAEHGLADGPTARWVAWACILVPDGVASSAGVVKLAERSGSPLLLGAALLRSGQPTQGAEALRPIAATDPIAGLYLALAEARLNRPKEARQAATRAQGAVKTEAHSWQQRLEWRLLLAEVEAALAALNKP